MRGSFGRGRKADWSIRCTTGTQEEIDRHALAARRRDDEIEEHRALTTVATDEADQSPS